MTTPVKRSIKNTASGASYFFKGFSLLNQKGIRRFVLIPLSINLLFFSFAFYYLLEKIESYMHIFESWLPDFLSWISTLLWPLVVISIVVLFSFVFSTISNWIAAPFNGLLSEKIEKELTGEYINDTSPADIIKDIPRTLNRELQKLLYYVPRLLGVVILFLLTWYIPFIGQIIWFTFTGWMMAVQYKDYPFDNHKISFERAKLTFKANKSLSYSFGFTATLFSLIPIVNFIVMPVAICGATLLWVEQYRDEYISGNE